jgi:zinc transport system ATP-binding protein
MSPEDDIVLEVRDLKVAIEGRVIIEGLSFTVKRGEILTILGPNGAGKTVLLRALLGILPHEGSIAWRKDMRIGYVPQRLPYIRDIPLSVEDFFALKGSTGLEARAMLRAVGLGEHLSKQQIGKLSSGQFQRALIAWALAGNPQVLLFDEPTAGIDVGGEETVYRLLARLHREHDLTMLLVTHDLNVVYNLSSTVLCLGRQAPCHGPPVEVLTPERLQAMYGTEVKFHQHSPSSAHG